MSIKDSASTNSAKTVHGAYRINYRHIRPIFIYHIIIIIGAPLPYISNCVSYTIWTITFR